MSERAPLFTPPAGLCLREAHGHLPMLGDALLQPDLSKCESVQECIDSVRSAIAGTPAGQWTLLRGARVQAWREHRWPTLAELDAASADRPVVVLSFDHHQAMANSQAMAAARLTANQHVAPNGLVCSDDHGQPTGLLMEAAAHQAWNSAPPLTRQQQVERVAAAAHHLADLGFREAHDLHAPPGLGEILSDLDRSGDLPLSVLLYAPFDRIEAETVAARGGLGGQGGYETARVRLAGGKLFADGTLNSQTAHVLTPYSGKQAADLGAFGTAMYSVEQIEKAVARCDAVGLHLAVHAIGDAAVRMTLDAFERVRPRTRGGRIEHCELIDPADVGRFKSLGVTCSLQPCHLLTDLEVLRRTLWHAERKVLPIKDLLDSGLTPGVVEGGLIFGSDVPIVRADPIDSITAAVLRRRPWMSEATSLNASQAIDVATAWSCFGMQ